LTINENDLQRDFRVEGGTEENLLFIDGSADRIGVATDAPTTELDVNGQIRMRTGAANGYVPTSDANGVMTWADPNTLISSVNELSDDDNDTQIQVEESADEDIIRFDVEAVQAGQFEKDVSDIEILSGFQQPSGLLTLNDYGLYLKGDGGNGGQVLTMEGQLGGSAYPYARMDFRNTDATLYTGASIRSYNGGATEDGDLRFYTASNQTLSEAMIIDYTGNVGIGTTGPQNELDVNGQIRMRDGAAPGYIPVSDANGVMTWTDPSTISDGDWTVSGLDIHNANAGNVGIGTATPTHLLHIDGTSAGVNSVLRTTGTGAYGSESRFNFGDGNYVFIEEDVDDDLRFHTDHGRIWLDASDGVGVGTDSPDATLDVNGDALINGHTVGRGGGDIGTNIVFGNGALQANTSGDRNIAIGVTALYNNTSGYRNIANGYQALYSNTSGDYNIALGYVSLRHNTTGNYNTGIGYLSLNKNTSGYQNNAVGVRAMQKNTTGYYNTASGMYAMQDNTTGRQNTSSGHSSLRKNIIGYQNAALGYKALENNTSGYRNTAIGASTLNLTTTGDYNTAIGYAARSNASYINNATAIGYSANATSSNSVRIGNSTINTIGGYANWSNVSDARFKTNIKEEVRGLDFIKKLRPVTYNLDMDAIASFNNTPDSLRLKEAEALKEEMLQTGFIAQEVEQAAQDLGYDFSGVDKPQNDQGSYGLRYAEFVVPLVKAMQEQQVMIEEQQKMLEAQTEELQRLKRTLGIDGVNK
jgi:hypothetical protein